jgi:indole-3-glycerol phosphate synthase
MRDLLRSIVDAKRAARASRPGDRLVDRTPPGPPRDFGRALDASGLAIVAEIKRRSPSAGALRTDLEPTSFARIFESAGAAALSVLTEPSFFGGSLDDLVAARQTIGLPVLRKDFLLDPSEIEESRRAGADAVLLIARILGPGQLDELAAAADEAGLTYVVEAHDERDLARAIDHPRAVIGINSRDLDTLAIDLDRALALRSSVPAGRRTLAESGVRTRAQLRRVAERGFDALLVGEALMRAADPGAALAELVAEARS